MRRSAPWIALATLLTACEHGPLARSWVSPGDAVLRETGVVGQLSRKALGEGSGLAPSTRSAGLYWALNDSGNEAELFALTATGDVRGSVRVRGAKNRDWEALAAGPCPEGSCLFIGDVGDNGARRASVQLYRLPEPAPPSGDNGARAPVDVSAMATLRFADGAHDIEAMYVAPDSSVWLVTKRPAARADGSPRPVHVHRVPLAAWSDSTPLPIIDSLPIVPRQDGGRGRDWPTDATLSPADSTGRRRLAVLTYGAIYVFEADSVTGRPGTLLGRCALPIPEHTSEGLTWLPDGRLLILNEGRGATLYAGKCP